jgi:two-component sensor histidine kinase
LDEPGPALIAASASARRNERLRVGLCVLLVLLGVSVVTGWLMQIEPLKSVVPGLSTMKFNTAIGFIAVGIGLGFAGAQRKSLRIVGTGVGLFVLMLGGISMLQYALGSDFGIDELIVRDRGVLSGSGHPGRMSLLTATAYVLLGCAIVLVAMATRRLEVIVGHSLAMFAGAISILAAAGYAFGAQAFFGIGPYTAIAIHTAAGLLIATAAALMTRARSGWLEPYADSPAALALLVRLLPLALAVPILLGLLIMLGAGLKIYNAPYGFALFIPLTCAAMVIAALWVAARQRQAEQVQLRYERHLQLVVAELNHRVKNTLSIVQSFAHQSLKNSGSAEEAGKAFEGRLTALASAHAILTRENWDTVNLTDLIADSLDVHNDTGTRIAIDGPEIPVSPKTAITLAMTLHELATNSMKYGALSVPDGYVRVRWRSEDGEFVLEWKECDGPATSEPRRKGFGTRMLTRALASELGGRARLDFEPDGLRYLIAAPARAEL